MKKFTKYQLVGHKDYIHYNPLTHKMAGIEIDSFTQDGKVYLYFTDDNIFPPPDYLRDPIDPEQ